MAYIGKSPDGTGVRSRFYYTQTSGGGTSVTGSSDDGTTLTFSDGAYVDVFLNGVLLVAGTDYNTTTANTIAGLAALANGDVIEVVVYDIFTVADTVSSLNGGTFASSVNFSSNIDVTTSTHANASVFKSTGNTQIMLQDTDATANDQFWGLQVSGGDFNILTCNDDRASGFVTPLTIDSSGRAVMPNQPCFSATAGGANIPLTTLTTLTLSSERFDVGNNLSSNTFTAPITGKYLFTYLLYFIDMDADCTGFDVHIKTSNKQDQQTFSPDHFLNSDSNFSVSGSVIADMDANDTCIFTVYIAGGAAQTDVHNDSQVSGCLLF